MFTGIIKEVNRVDKVIRANSLIKLGIKSDLILPELKPADSISVNGVCLTLVKKEKDLLLFDAIPSTFKNTNLKRLKKGNFVNLEPALNLGEKLSGHFVLGHVDSELKLRRIIKKNSYCQLEIELPSAYRKFILDNGSIGVEGISLTVKKVLTKIFTVDIIPFTYQNTNLKYKRSGDWLNIEFDYLLKNKK